MPETAINALILPWLQDVTRAAQHLTRLWRAAEAEAALITRGASLWAFAGNLPRADIQALTEAIVRYWWQGERARRKGGESAGDWVRFVRLPESQKEYLLYATPLGEEMGLALVFDAATPFSRIRTQTGNLRRALAEPPNPEDLFPEPAPAVSEAAPAVAPAKDEAFEEGEALPAEVDAGDELPLVPLFSTDLVPPPTPAEAEAANERAAQARSFLAELFASVEKQGQARVVVGPAPETLPPDLAAGSDELIPVTAGAEPEHGKNGRYGEAGRLELIYACALVPRLPQHQLIGPYAERLKAWLPPLAQAFGWRIERVTIHGDYLLWVCRLPAELAPADVLKTVRFQTSQRMFFEFPPLAQENTSGDFWAPEGLIQTMASSPDLAEALKAYLAAVRR